MTTSVIISTYNSPIWLQKVLWGYFSQSRNDFEIVIADDGSADDTKILIKDMAKSSPVRLTHVWQPDEGFQKCRILNKALAVATGQRILLTDGDCIPRQDFVDTHSRLAIPEHFLTGTYFKVPENIATIISEGTIKNKEAVRAKWLLDQGLPFSGKLLKLISLPPFDRWLNKLTPAKKTWNGHSASCLRIQALQVNGFNEEMQYGGLDVEFGLRLMHAGIKPQHIRYSTITLHLHHEHGYVTPTMLENSKRLR